MLKPISVWGNLLLLPDREALGGIAEGLRAERVTLANAEVTSARREIQKREEKTLLSQQIAIGQSQTSKSPL